MIALLVGQPCPKSCHTAPQPTLEEAFAEQTSAVANFSLSSLLLIGLPRAQVEPLRIELRMYCTVPPQHRGETNYNAKNRLLVNDEHTENSTSCSFNFVEG